MDPPVLAEDRCGGVRPSSGAAMLERQRTLNEAERTGTSGGRCARGQAHSDNPATRG
jgi:hypothetical protein